MAAFLEIYDAIEEEIMTHTQVFKIGQYSILKNNQRNVVDGVHVIIGLMKLVCYFGL